MEWLPDRLSGNANKKPAQGGKKYQGQKRRRGSRNGPKVEGYGCLLRCGNNALMDWIMSQSSGQAIIWRTIQDSNLKPIA